MGGGFIMIIGMLFVCVPMLFLSAYVTSIDKYNGNPENTTNVIVWGIIILYLIFKVFLGGL